MSFARHPNHKDSGVEWLGEVPSDWEISRLGFESWVRARLGWKGLKAEEYVDDGFAFLSTPNIKGREIDFADVNYIDLSRFDESPEIKLREGDVLLAKDGSTLGAVNIVRVLPQPATVNSSIAVITPNPRLSGVFLYYLFKSSYMENTIQRIKGGMGVPHLFQADLNKFYLPLPPLDEQHLIAEFLDRETLKIDELVSEQQRLIELLREKRQALISHAVAKGLSSHVPMKLSGIAWLGDVPEHWRVTPLKHLGSLKGRLGWQGLRADEYTESGPFLVTSEHFADDRIDWRRCYHVSPDRYALAPEIQLRSDDLLMMKDGAAMGKLAYVDRLPGPACLNSHLLLFRPRSGQFLNRFLYYVLGGPGFRTYMVQERTGTTFFGISQESIGAFPFAVPPLAEQEQILDFLDLETAKLDALTVEVSRAVELLRERLVALISAAVTGKIDVRGLIETATT